MFKSLSFIALMAWVANASQSLDLQYSNYTYESFLQQFDLKYHPSETAARKALFEEELKRVRAHNAASSSWTMGFNKFSVLTADEKKAFFGRNKRVAKRKSPLRQELPKDFPMMPLEKLPKNVDWRQKGVVSAVKDQGHCGSCWAFASTETIESHVAIASGLLYDLSVEQVAMCTPNPQQCGGSGGCNGATSELAFEYVSNSNGLFQEYQYSYTSYYGGEFDCALPTGTSPKAKVNGYVQLPANNYQAVMNAVANVGPVALAVDASAWSSYSSGIFNGCNQVNPDIDHGVVLVGYGEEKGQKYWLIRNSWSPSWGEHGYIRVARDENEQQKCGQDITPQDGIACAGDDTPVTVCGTCGVIFDVSYPLNAVAL